MAPRIYGERDYYNNHERRPITTEEYSRLYMNGGGPIPDESIRAEPIREERINHHDRSYYEYRIRVPKNAPIGEARKRLEYARMEVQELIREERQPNDVRIAHRIIEMLRGLMLGDEAYHVLRKEIEYCYCRYRDDRERMMMPPIEEWEHMEFRKDMADTFKEERKDFLDEEEMKL